MADAPVADDAAGAFARRAPDSLNVLGPYYVEDGCCTSYGVPHAIAPELFSEIEEEHCYVRRQPETSAETDSMLRVIATQELGCIRYGGSHPAIVRRLVESGEGDQCDLPALRGVVPNRRDHITFTARPRATPLTAREILERMWRSIAVGGRLHSTNEAVDGSASVSVSWFEDNYHRIEALHAGDSEEVPRLLTECGEHVGPSERIDHRLDLVLG